MASRPFLSLLGMDNGHAVQSKCTISEKPPRDARCKGVWPSSLREMLEVVTKELDLESESGKVEGASWPRDRRRRTIGR